MNLKPATQELRIAIVEDDFATRQLLAGMISAEPDFKIVAEFSEGATAIASLPGVAPDVLLVDIGLPDISGIEVIRNVAATLPQCDVLVVTTLGDEQTILSALEAGADGYIFKGLESAQLRRDIRTLRDGGSPLSPLAARSLLDKFNKGDKRSAGTADPPSQLTNREIQILQTIAHGHTYVETSAICSISAGTVHSHLKNIYRKLEANSKVQAINKARLNKIIT